MKPLIIITVLLIGLLVGYHTGLFGAATNTSNNVAVIDFDTCAAAGNEVMESYPRQCRSEAGDLFVENIGNELDKMGLIRIDSPRPNDVVASPLTITGQARGYWFFEASFPIVVTDWDGVIIGEGYATADLSDGGTWMTEEFVPFTATITFEVPTGTPYHRGTLILRKDNPSGLPEHDDALEIPVRFE